MSTYQTTYSAAPAKGLPGQVANEEKCNKVSRTVESAAGIGFGQPAFRGSGDHGVVVGGTFAATGAGSAASGNVGTGTITASPTITAGAKQGRYQAVLLATSHPTTTSPVLRGKWVLENIVGTPPPAPPANLDTALKTDPRVGALVERFRAIAGKETV